jgi:hypothetical protein
LNKDTLVEDATLNIVFVDPDVPTTVNFDVGVDDPIPVFPVCSTVKRVVPVEEAIVTGFVPAIDCKYNEEVVGVVVPIRRLPVEEILTLSKEEPNPPVS